MVSTAKKINIDVRPKPFKDDPATQQAEEAKPATQKTEQDDLAEREKKVPAKLRLAKQILKKNKISGNKWLRNVMKEYPGTATAVEVEKLLKGK